MSEANSPDPLSEQNRQPPVPLVPSRLGQVKPPSMASLMVFSPKYCFSQVLME